ncbi:bifunctional triacylglycerol lipase/ester hydrolase Ecym_1241 [Eremothecium cymbalariae DBVPG|uniref:AB hydrolase-1 domain-containing protein n=1 Tax=Eremothecium cymbalariae (strain CBS 270.75 / DBVPG 7215 / KCTC 17166 / NRRL Y-17582) TaxID=931890 RepID=G8JN22_ERECY|nr:hypothetical protein Ecym_1241 [Eremothecium cymbalariae DBVPG\
METYLREDIFADILHIYSQSTPPGPLLLFIPGNPGLINFYEEFLKCIHERNPTWEVVGIGHTGMSSLRENNSLSGRVHTLDEQIEDKVKVINEFVDAGGDRCIKLIGHSIGAYMVQKIALHKGLRGKIDMVMLLTPTIIDIHRSSKGVQLTRISDWFPKFYEYAYVVDRVLFKWILPTSWIEWIARKLIGGSDECVLQSAQKLVSTPEFVKQALGLAQIEMYQVRNQWDFQDEFISFCQANKIKVRFLFSGHDHWVHPDTMKDIIELYEAKYSSDEKDLLNITIDGHINHSFVVKDTTKVVNIYF